MGQPLELTERQQQVLQATVEHYVATGEPVGSRTLMTQYRIPASPATIRQAMGRLEQVGLLYQPHASAGRIPSDLGYRCYVDWLLWRAETVSPAWAEAALPTGVEHLEGALRQAAQLLSQLSGSIIVVTRPQPRSTRLKHLRLVAVGERVALMVVLEGERVESTLLDWVPPTQVELDSALDMLGQFLNYHLQGRSLRDIATLDWPLLEREFASYGDWLRTLMPPLTQQLRFWGRATTPTPLVISGVASALRQPEFQQAEQVQPVMQVLETQQERLGALLWDEDASVQVIIGQENPLVPMHICSLVSTMYLQNGVPVGSVAILGPKRMAYGRMIALVQAGAHYVSQSLGAIKDGTG
ncbi:Negative regulator of class I heat shock protein [Gloeomargarita lithophora Alchichica-D10]|uniref:Heat-inducible transcription repressor HrcA n=1 Tax=Gloeomargarita lithophora Alchichica-D10 TaxID=1188229 RepID=A0A1J0AE64_9CYAN|nr:heat-inducible transcriptional repressor HrcA [Gloeomargarita lithophora]APB34234.1 Negative regulator of class I heat shock protein [Gloeomargarita lithophora Alchichica-D10]